MSDSRKWTVVIRNRRGDPYFHRVPNLNLTFGEATQLAEYLMRRNPVCQALHAWQDAKTQTTVKIRKKNRQWADIKIRDNGTLPFDTNPHGKEEVKPRYRSPALTEPKPKPKAEAGIPQVTDVELANAVKLVALPGNTGMFNVYDGETHIGEVDYTDVGDGLPWVATAYTYSLDAPINELGGFPTRVRAVAAVVRLYQQVHSKGE